MPGQATVTIENKTWTCVVASTASELEIGLSETPYLPVGQGMLFDLGSSRIVTVNAYSMTYPIAIVFIDENMVIVAFTPILIPGHDTTTVVPCRYFLEVGYEDLGDSQPQLGEGAVITGYTPSVSISVVISIMMTAMIIMMMMQMMMKTMKEIK